MSEHVTTVESHVSARACLSGGLTENPLMMWVLDVKKTAPVGAFHFWNQIKDAQMKTVCSTFLLIAAGLLAFGASSSCSAAPDEPVTLSPRGSDKMHHVHSELRLPGMRDYLVLNQIHCVGEREAAKLPAAPRLTKETIDPRMWVIAMDEYISSDRMATYTRSYEEGRLSDECVIVGAYEEIEFESQFADGRKIRWSRADGVYRERVEEKRDLSKLKKMISESLREGNTTSSSREAGPQLDMDKTQAATGRRLSVTGIPCAEYRFPAQNMTICSAQVSDPVPMMDLLGQNSLILSVSITGDVFATRDRRATKVLLSQPIDQSVFDPKSL